MPASSVLHFFSGMILWLVIAMVTTLPVKGQNCVVDFPGVSSLNYSSTCGSASIFNFNLGTSIFMGDNDIFTFDAPATITVDGNLVVQAEGNGKIIIPAGVIVNVLGNFQLGPQNGGCENGNSCAFEMEVNGTLNVIENFQNNLTTLIWSGTGIVAVDDRFGNSSDGCMECSNTSCPGFPAGNSCQDNNGGCSGGNFCVDGNYGNSAPLQTDFTTPVISNCPGNQIVSLTGSNCEEAVNWTPPTATDDVGVSSFVSNYNPGEAFLVGITTVTYTAIDASGNAASCNFDVTVNDNTPPIIVNCPGNIVMSLTGSDCDESVIWVAPTASDNCSVSSFASNYDPGDVFPVGITMVTYTATDASGNIATCNFDVTVNDNTPPVIANCPGNIVMSLTGSVCDETVNWALPTVSDNCSVSSFTSDYKPGDIFPLGTTTVTYTATDLSGNEAICTFNITIKDNIVPVIEQCPPIISISGYDSTLESAMVSWNIPSASDNCKAVSLTGTHNPGDSFPKGKTTVTYTAQDEAGNTSTCSFEVEVTGNNTPIVQPVSVNIQAGQSVKICLEATDPDGDPLILNAVNYSLTNGQIDMVDTVSLCFTYTPQEGFEGVELIPVIVCDDQDPAACTDVEVQIEVFIDAELIIYKAFTPNNDNINDTWQIGNIEYYPGNKVMIFDRWGSLVYKATGYNNESVIWDGSSNQRAFGGRNIVPSGTYFYTIDLGDERSPKKGFVELVQ